MVKCWYLSSDNLLKPREPNYFDTTNESKTDNNESNVNSIKKISWSTLSQFGIQYWFIEIDKIKITNKLEMIKLYQNCPNSDAVIFNDKHNDIQNYAEFGFKSHVHDQNEIRLIIDGELYYDIYTNKNKVIRIHLKKGDLILVPKGLFHRVIIPNNINETTFFNLYNKVNPKIKTFFIKDILFNNNDFYDIMKTIKIKNNKSPNGKGIILNQRAKALASYPHLRQYNGILYVSGTSSRRPNNTHVGATKNIQTGKWTLDIKLQTRAVLENIKLILNSVNAGLEHCLQLTVFLIDFNDYAGMNEIYNEYFDAKSGPTRTCVAVARLPHPNLLIEIQAIAAQPTNQT